MTVTHTTDISTSESNWGLTAPTLNAWLGGSPMQRWHGFRDPRVHVSMIWWSSLCVFNWFVGLDGSATSCWRRPLSSFHARHMSFQRRPQFRTNLKLSLSLNYDWNQLNSQAESEEYRTFAPSCSAHIAWIEWTIFDLMHFWTNPQRALAPQMHCKLPGCFRYLEAYAAYTFRYFFASAFLCFAVGRRKQKQYGQ